MAKAYYDVPMLKKPVWTWEVPAYFFLGGLSSGAFLLSRAAAHHRLAPLMRTATWTAAAALVPCAPLLISDLGDPARFHHMMRVFKPSSPMNLGTWVLTGYSAVVGLACMRDFARTRCEIPAAVDAVAEAVQDVAGVPLALLLGTYTGVLLSCTATPVWTENAWLPAVFASGGFHNGTAAVALALELLRQDDASTRRALDRIDLAGTVVEGVAMAGYLTTAAPFAQAMTRGQMGPMFWGGAIGAGLVLPAVVKKMGKGRWARVAAHALTLAGGMALRWAVLKAGEISAGDPAAARVSSARS